MSTAAIHSLHCTRSAKVDPLTEMSNKTTPCNKVVENQDANKKAYMP